MKFKRLLYLLRPSFWLRNYPYSEYWDEQLNKMLDAPEFKDDGHHTILLNGVRIWVSNYPYAYGTPRITTEVMPRRETVERLHMAVLKFKIESAIKGT